MIVMKLCCLVFPLLNQGDEWRAMLEEALDQTTELDLDNRPIVEAFDAIVQDTGVQVNIAQETLDLLPYGRNTRLNARIHNMSLREGLARMTAPLGLRLEVGQRSLELVPSPALARIGRRATWDELETLAELRQTEFTRGSANVDTLADRIQFQVGEPEPWPLLREALVNVGPGQADNVLTLACDSLGWTWFPSGKHIAVVRKVDQQLRQSVTLRQTSRKLIDVLQTIGDQAGVTIRCEPGAIAALPPQTRSNFSLYVENKSLADTLELIAATTGLGFEVLADAIVFYHPDSDSAQPDQTAGAPPRRADPYVGKITLPPSPDGVQVDLLIHESDLSPETNELRRKYLDRADEVIKEALERLEQQGQR